ncbi:hypothetical protein A2U01_0110282, partial [Trifolium medium]|nr:hypothetical protein [Trifolium medium]
AASSASNKPPTLTIKKEPGLFERELVILKLAMLLRNSRL